MATRQTTKKTELQQALEMLIDQCELDGELRTYSGRGMMGKQCLAINCEVGAVGGALLVSALLDKDLQNLDDWLPDLLDQLEDTRTDSLGMGVITYWPSVPFIEGENDNNDQGG